MMRIIFTVFATYVLFIVALYFLQRTLIYFPDKSRPIPVENVEIVHVNTVDGLDLEGWYFAAKDTSKPVVVFFHGNAGNHGLRIYKAQYYLNAGYGVLLAGYRGYGGNPGVPHEFGFYKDGRAYLNWLENVKGISNQGVVIYGESIGSGTAVQMASEYKVAGLILEVPFSSLVDVARETYFFIPVTYLLKDHFKNTEKIIDVNCPILIMHGQKDSVIPFSSAQKLFDAAIEPKSFITFPQGKHNDLYDFKAYHHVLEFLSGIRDYYEDNKDEKDF